MKEEKKTAIKRSLKNNSGESSDEARKGKILEAAMQKIAEWQPLPAISYFYLHDSGFIISYSYPILWLPPTPKFDFLKQTLSKHHFSKLL